MRVFTHAHLIPIQSSRYSILSNLPQLSVDVLFVLYVASPRKNFSQGPSCVLAVALLMLYSGQNDAWWARKILNRLFQSTNYSQKKTPVLAIAFRLPMTSVILYLNLHIKAESWRMKTTKPPYFIVTLCRFIFRSQKYLLLLSSPSTAMMTPW
jgi:hypothetical protein